MNLEDSFSLEKENITKIINFIKTQLDKKNQRTNILFISNLSFQVFERIFKDKLFLKEINPVIEYVDYSTFLSIQKINIKKYSFIFFIPDTSDFTEISETGDDLYFNKKNLDQIKNFYNLIIEKMCSYNSKIFIGNLVNFENLDFGTYSKNLNNLRIELIKKINLFLQKTTLDKNFYLLDIETITYKFGINRYRDPSKFLYARIPFTIDYSNYFFSILVNLILIAQGKIKKLLILDLDNTLWGGILGDDGPNGVIIGNDSPTGRAFLDFQKTILNLQKRGVLLAICSKNNLENVNNIFKKNKNLILKLSHFVIVKANWNNKAQNIQEISNELNLGTDSFVFFDDNPVEREFVRLNHPEISIPELNEDPSSYSSVLLDNYYFDLVNFSKEDLNRSKTYSQNLKREKLKTKFYDINDYLSSLKMVCSIDKFKSENFNRIVQLFQRSNQFNFTTIRYSLSEIEKISKNKKNVTFQFSFKDKFSNYGIISLITAHTSNNNLVIDNWVMSCRVLNRTLENFIMNIIVDFCIKKKIKFIKSQYITTNKNSLVKNLFDELGFNQENKSRNKKQYILKLNRYVNKKTFIKNYK